MLRDLEAAGLLSGTTIDILSVGPRVSEVRVEGRRQFVSPTLAEAIHLEIKDQAPVA
jgi:hypothetical protein